MSTHADAFDPTIVLVTFPGAKDPMPLARTLVEERLAACVNVLPEMHSVYRWDEAIQEDGERQLVIKTTRARLAALEARVHELHPYEVPEFLVIAASAGERYAAWLAESTTGA